MGSAQSLDVVCCDTAEKDELGLLLHRRGTYPAQKSQEQHKVPHFEPPRMGMAAYKSPVHRTSPEQPMWRAASQSASQPSRGAALIEIYQSSEQLQRTSPGQPTGRAASQASEQLQRTMPAPQASERLQRTMPASQASERLQSTSPGQPLVDRISSRQVFGTKQLPPSPLGWEASLSSEKKQVTFPGRPLVDRRSSGSFGSSASTLVASLPSARLLQAELDFCRSSPAHNTPQSSVLNTPCPSAAPNTPRPDDAPGPAPAFGGFELARTLGLKLSRESEPRVMEVRERTPCLSRPQTPAWGLRIR